MDSVVYNIDCMEYMKTLKDNVNEWDIAPNQEYFDELFRISKNQIIWGGNYFRLPPARCFLIWNKKNIPENFSMAMVEYAWTSFQNKNAKIFTCVSQDKNRVHATQKPVALYKWVLSLFAEQGDNIFDSHLGSGSLRIACHDGGYAFVSCEIITYKKNALLNIAPKKNYSNGNMAG